MENEKAVVCEIIAELRNAENARAAREAGEELLAHAMHAKSIDVRIRAAAAICNSAHMKPASDKECPRGLEGVQSHE